MLRPLLHLHFSPGSAGDHTDPHGPGQAPGLSHEPALFAGGGDHLWVAVERLAERSCHLAPALIDSLLASIDNPEAGT